MVVVEAGESKTFEIVRVKPDVYEATFVRDEAYQKDTDNRLKLFFEIEVKENDEQVTKELMFTCPFPNIMTENTKLGSILKLLGHSDFTPNLKYNTEAYYGKKLRVVIKDWDHKDIDGQAVVSSQITDFM